MNFIFISPNFPEAYRHFCECLKMNGVNVFGIGDCPYEELSDGLKWALTEYYRVDNMEDYDSMYRAVAHFASGYGRIDWIESNNEYWLNQDAHLREDFNVRTGVQPDELALWQSKSSMKPVYREAGIPSARNHKVTDIVAARAFLEEIGGFPVFCKPDVGVGASDTFKIDDEEGLAAFFRDKPDVPYVMEEFVNGEIYSYDCICDSQGNPIFESSFKCPNVADTVNSDQESLYYVFPGVEEQLRDYGRRALKAFRVKSRFIHFEFFRLKEARKGLGNAGDFVGLEVNMRPAGGFTPDMINFAHSCNVYQIWADMITADKRLEQGSPEDCYCVFAGRKDRFEHVATHGQIIERFRDNIVIAERLPDVFAAAMGNQVYIAKFDTFEEVCEFGRYVLEYNFDYVMTH